MRTSGVQAAAANALASGDRQRFLADLTGAPGLAERGEYAEAGNDPGHALRALRTVNEMFIVVAAQLRPGQRGGGIP